MYGRIGRFAALVAVTLIAAVQVLASFPAPNDNLLTIAFVTLAALLFVLVTLWLELRDIARLMKQVLLEGKAPHSDVK